MGLGLFGGGVGVARHLVTLGYDVTVTDVKDAASLDRSVRALDGLPIRFVLGRHDDIDFTQTDLLIANPAVPPTNRHLALAAAAGVRVDTEIGLFVRGCRAPMVGITGSAGKSTTSALVTACLSRLPVPGRVLLGGNIGRSLLDELPTITADDRVVLELSSFQLHWLAKEGLGPTVAAITNIAPNHLDWHGTMDAYVADKAGIVPRNGGVLVAFFDDLRVREIAERAVAAGSGCRVVWTASTGDGLPSGDAVYWRGERLVARVAGGDEAEILTRSDLRILGDHAALNVATAVATCLATLEVSDPGAVATPIREAVRGFDALAHRLQPIATTPGGILCVDDSKSTTPESSITAMRAFSAKILLLAGGYDKGIDPKPMVDAAVTRVRAMLCYGAMGPTLHRLCEERGVPSILTSDLEGAVAAAFLVAGRDDVLLLSPGHASWDQFKNYEERAARFAALVARVIDTQIAAADPTHPTTPGASSVGQSAATE